MDRRFALLLVCFLLSGFSALLYQTAWTREFSFVFGTSEIAVAAVLAGYMGGLAVGSAAASRIAPRLSRPVLVYGLLELGIALSALAVPLGMRALTAAYVALFGGGEVTEPGALATVFRLGGAFLLMLTPTAFMGATLPLLVRHAIRRDEDVGPRIGALYAINTAGAIGGTLCAAFLLLPALGLRQTVYLGAVVNVFVFAFAALLARRAPAPAAMPVRAMPAARGLHWILPLMLVSGAVSFSYEVLWTRLLSHLLGGSVYAFATMLSSFLLGIALGSAAGGRVARQPGRARAGFAVSQIGIAGLALGAFMLSDRLPQLAKAFGAGGMAGPVANAPIAVVVLLPVALCIGATFPLAVRILAADAAGTASAAARVYAWNTVGAIAGSIGAGFILLPWLGLAGTVRAGVATSLCLAAAASLLGRPRLRRPLVAVALSALALLALPVDTPWQLLRSSPLSAQAAAGEVRYYGAGRSATVMLLEFPGSFKLITNGLPEAAFRKPMGIPGRGLEARWLGFLPVLLRPDAERMLVVGLGGGVAVEGVPPSVVTLDVVELEGEVVAANREAGPERAVDPLADPRTRVVVNDARGALLLTDHRYDAIVSQPSHPWTAGASHLYTREFFELARDRLENDGVFVQWIGLRFIDPALLQSLLATLSSVFPHVHVYNPVKAALLFAGSKAPLDIVPGRAALDASAEHFARYGILTIEDAAAALVLDTQGVRDVGAGAPINSDDHNQLAARSARLGDARLDFASLRRMLLDHDPLPALSSRLERMQLIRSLIRKPQLGRASRVADSFPELSREIALGWVAASRDRSKLAQAHFGRALALAPDSFEAHAGPAVFDLPESSAAEPPDGVAILRRARELDVRGEMAGLAALDAELAAFGVGNPLRDPAIRLRISWRIRSGDPERGAEAMELLDRMLPRRDRPSLGLRRAQAAHVAGRPETAWVALDDVSRRIQPGRASGPTRRRAFALIGRLPDHALKAAIRARLSAGAE